MASSREKRERRYGSAKERAEKHESGFAMTSLKLPPDVSLWSPKKAGIYRIEIVPFEVGKGNPFADEGIVWYERTYFVHKNVGVEENAYCCPQKTAGKPCPICDDISRMERKADVDKDAIKALKRKERQLFLILDHAEEEKGLQLWDVSHYLFGQLLDTKIKNADEDEPYGDFFYEGKEGLTLKLTFVEKSFAGNSFLEVKDIEFKPRKVALDQELVDNAPCLDECPIVLPFDKLKSIYLQEDMDEADEDEEDEEDEAPRKKSKKAPVDDDEDDDNADDDEPPAKSKKKTAPPEDDEDDDPPPKKKKAPVEEDDEEEDDEPPAKPKKKKPPVDDDEDDDPPPKSKKPTANQLGIRVESVVEYERELYWVTIVSKDGYKLCLKNTEDAQDIVDDVPLQEVELLEEDDKRLKRLKPAKGKQAAAKEEDDEPPAKPKKKKPPVDDDEDDDPPPKKKKAPVEDDEDDDPPPKKSKKRKASADDDDDDDETPF